MTENVETTPQNYPEEKFRQFLKAVDMAEGDKEAAVGLIPDLRSTTVQFLDKEGISLSRVESDGFTPFLGAALDMRVLPTSDGGGYLLAEDVGEANQDDPKRYVVMGGKVDRQVYVQWEPDEGENRKGSWVLTDMRGGEVAKQKMSQDAAGKFKPAKLDGRTITNPFIPYGSSIIVGNRQHLPEGPKLAKFSKGWVNKLL